MPTSSIAIGQTWSLRPRNRSWRYTTTSRWGGWIGWITSNSGWTSWISSRCWCHARIRWIWAAAGMLHLQSPLLRKTSLLFAFVSSLCSFEFWKAQSKQRHDGSGLFGYRSQGEDRFSSCHEVFANGSARSHHHTLSSRCTTLLFGWGRFRKIPLSG